MGGNKSSFKISDESFFDQALSPHDQDIVDIVSSVVDRYVDFEDYSEGGIKKIRKCTDLRTGRIVAMATLKANAETGRIEQFLKEARLNAILQHPNIIPVHDLGIGEDGKPWFTMKFIEGQTLGDILKELDQEKSNKFENLNERLDLFNKVCDAIAFSHSKGIVHLDLKPENIRVNKFGDVVVCDWGLADVNITECDELLLEVCSLTTIDLTEMTLDGAVKGTPGYMAPEQTPLVRERKGKHSDIFSLGAILYSILTYDRAFKGSNLEEVLNDIAECKFQKPSELKPELHIPISIEAVCLRAMAKDPEQRYASVEELQKDVLAFRNGFTTDAENASIGKAVKLMVFRHKALSLLLCLVIAAGLSFTLVFINNLSLERINAVQLAEKTLIEKEYHARLNKESAPRFLDAALAAYKSFSLNDALKFSSTAAELNENLKDAWLLKGKLHFAREEFSKAVKAFQKADDNGIISKMAKEYEAKVQKSGKKLTSLEYSTLTKKVRENKMFRSHADLIHQKAYSNIPLDYRIKFCEETIKIHHNYTKDFKLNFNKETKHLNCYGQKWIQAALSLQNFPAKSVDFSHTSIRDFISFRNMPLKKLDVSHTSIVDLKSLNNKGLTHLNLSYTSTLNIANLAGLPLEVLDISHSQVSVLYTIKELPKLKTLILHKNQYTPNILKQVPDSVEIKLVD